MTRLLRSTWMTLTCMLLLGIAAGSATAQDRGTLRGTILDEETQEPLVGANVVLRTMGRGTSADAEGQYRIRNLPTGTHTVAITFVGYERVTREVTVRAGQTTTLDVSLAPTRFIGEEVVVTGSKQAEKVLEAPVTVEAITAQSLETSGGGTFLSALSNLKGIDYANVGINGQSISARGFNNHFNTRMLSMKDGRVAQLPGTGLPQGNFIPTAGIDVKSIEVVVGPASALYGPNAHTGVVNIITKDPWDDSGLDLQVRGGGNDLFDGNVRAAGLINEDFGWKVTGQYLTATDFKPTRARGTHNFGSDFFEAELVKDYDVEMLRTEGSLYYRFGDGWKLSGTYGFSENDNFGLTNNGRNRILGWQVQFQNIQLSHPNWYLQFTRTTNDAGDTYQINGVAAGAQAALDQGVPRSQIPLQDLRNANTFVDNGEMLDSEAQYSRTIGNAELTTGVQARRFLPDSEGTFLADASGQDIDANLFGGYLQLDYRMLDDRLRLNAAARLDEHSEYDTQFSPKAALVYTVAENHNVRATFNRAFKSPTILNQHLFLGVAQLGNVFLGNTEGYTIRDAPTASGNLVREISPLDPEQVNSLEVGYKGIIGDKLFVDAVAYNSWYEDFISPLTNVANPAAGTFAFDSSGELVAGNGFLWTYLNFGEATVRGVDLGLNVYASDRLSFSGKVSYIDLYDFTSGDASQDQLRLNVPAWKLKGSATLKDAGFDGYFVSLTGRWQAEYPFVSGYWDSRLFYDDNNGRVPSRFVVNLTAGYDIPNSGASLKLSVSNLFDNERVDVLGAPERGRLLWIGATYSLNGLRF